MGNNNNTATEAGANSAPGDIKGAAGLAWGVLASTRLSAFILCAMGLLFVAGVIFSHGGPEGYLRDGDGLVFLTRRPGVTALFSSPVFLALCIALFVNLVAGAYNRILTIRTPRERFAPTHTISLTQNGAEAATDARHALEDELGFRVKTSGGDWVVTEKGVPHSYLAWAYYAGIAVCLAGVAMTHLFASEQTITLTQGQPAAIQTAMRDSLSSSSAGPRLVSGPFTAIYTEGAVPAGPDNFLSKLAASLSPGRPVYEQRAGSLYPVDWKLGLAVVNGGVTVREGSIASGSPFRHKGYAFYLDGLEQSFRVRVENNPLTLSARDSEELVIPGIGPGLPVRFSIFRTGAIKKDDGSVEIIAPHTRIRLSGDSGEDLGRISPGESIYINGTRLTLVKVVEKAELISRYDPGSALLRWGGVLVLATIALRLLGPFQTVAYSVDYSAPIVRLRLHIASKGLVASPKRLFKRLERIMTSNDIRPIPLPGGRLK